MTWPALVLVAQMAPPTVPTPMPAPPSGSAAPIEQDEPDDFGEPPPAAAPATPPVAAPPPVAPSPVAQAPVPIVMLPYPPQEAPPPRPHRHVIVEFAGGAYYHRLFSVQAYGGGGRFAIGTAGKTNAWTVGFEYLGGQTFHGLGLRMWRLGWSWDWVFDRFRVGLHPNLGMASLDRATRSHDPIEQVSLGIDLHGSVDLVPIGSEGALFARAVINVDAETWGPSLWLGLRFGP